MAVKLETSVLSDDDVQKLKAILWAGSGFPVESTNKSVQAAPAFAAASASAAAPTMTVVAEGDSWFDYSPGLDILDQLKLLYRYNIVKLAHAGDTIENIAFGTQFDRSFGRPEPQINVLVGEVDRLRPKVVLLSGGGNDVAGDQFAGFLNHSDSGLPHLRKSYVKDVIHGVVRRAYKRIADEIWRIDPTIAIVTHGYGYAIPDGRAVFNFPFGYRFVGPWLRPALVSKNITKLGDGKAIVKSIIDEFNTMLSGLQTKLSGPFRFVDLRKTVKTDDWVNELHVSGESYGRCADKFHQAIKSVAVT
jgi:hypothetical protein